MKGFLIVCHVLLCVIGSAFVVLFLPTFAAFFAVLILGCVIVALWRAIVLKKY